MAADVRRRYCSEECGSKAFYARRIADGRMSQVMADRSAKRAEKKRPCTGCGKLLAYAHLEMPRCRDCGPARKSEVRIRAERRARSAARGVRRQRNLVSGCCVDCGSWWVSFHQSTRCKDCADHRVTDGMKAAKRRRKEREKGFKLTKFRRLAIFERDDWTCRICHAPIDRSATAPSPLAASIDHRVPLSVGGKHELANLQAAHFRCNVRKGNRERALVAPLRVAA